MKAQNLRAKNTFLLACGELATISLEPCLSRSLAREVRLSFTPRSALPYKWEMKPVSLRLLVVQNPDKTDVCSSILWFWTLYRFLFDHQNREKTDICSNILWFRTLYWFLFDFNHRRPNSSEHNPKIGHRTYLHSYTHDDTVATCCLTAVATKINDSTFNFSWSWNILSVSQPSSIWRQSVSTYFTNSSLINITAWRTYNTWTRLFSVFLNLLILSSLCVFPVSSNSGVRFSA